MARLLRVAPPEARDQHFANWAAEPLETAEEQTAEPLTSNQCNASISNETLPTIRALIARAVS